MQEEIDKRSFVCRLNKDTNNGMASSSSSTESLSTGALARYQNGQIEEPAVVRIVDIRPCQGPTTSKENGTQDERYRLSITDGKDTFNACMLAPELNKLISEQRLRPDSIVRLERVFHNLTATGKPFLLILDLTILQNIIPKTPPPSNTRLCPISMITPYINGLWKIRARCFAKSPIRSHPVCDFDFVDESGEIRAVAFGNETNLFHPMIEVNKVYEILGVRVKMANKKWNHLRHDYELSLIGGSIIRPIDDPEVIATLPEMNFDLIPLRDIARKGKESLIDVIGIVEHCSNVISFVNKTSNRDSKRREITLIDEDTSISITLWDDQAENFDSDLAENHTVVAFKGIRVAIYNNKYSLSGHKNMSIKVDPNVAEARHLRIWYDAGGRHSNNTAAAVTSTRPATEDPWKTLAQIEREQLGHSGRPDYVTIKGTCMHIANDRVVYMSCPTDDCRRKVVLRSTGRYYCDKCQIDHDQCRWSYMFRAEVVDSTGALWVSFFGQQAETLMGGVSAGQFAEAKERKDDVLVQKYLTENCFREQIFKFRINEETFNDTRTVKISCISISDVDFVQYGRRLLANISRM